MRVVSLFLALILILAGCGEGTSEPTVGESAFKQKDAHLSSRLVLNEDDPNEDPDFCYIGLSGEKLPCINGSDKGSDATRVNCERRHVAMEVELIEDEKENADYLIWELCKERPHGNIDYAHAVLEDTVYICERLESGKLARVTVRHFTEYYDKSLFRNACLLYGIDPEGGYNA